MGILATKGLKKDVAVRSIFCIMLELKYELH